MEPMLYKNWSKLIRIFLKCTDIIWIFLAVYHRVNALPNVTNTAAVDKQWLCSSSFCIQSQNSPCLVFRHTAHIYSYQPFWSSVVLSLNRCRTSLLVQWTCCPTMKTKSQSTRQNASPHESFGSPPIVAGHGEFSVIAATPDDNLISIHFFLAL